MSALFLSNPEKNKKHGGLGVKAHGDKDHGMCSIHSEIPQTTPTLYEASLTAALLARDRQAYSSLTVGRCFTHGRNLVCMKHRRLSVLYYPSLTFPLTSSGALLEIPFAQPWRYLSPPPQRLPMAGRLVSSECLLGCLCPNSRLSSIIRSCLTVHSTARTLFTSPNFLRHHVVMCTIRAAQNTLENPSAPFHNGKWRKWFQYTVMWY